MGISPRTNRPYAKTPNSNIYKHFLDTNHAIDSNNFSIIFSANDTSLKVAESICIHKLSPSLNGTMYSTPLHILGRKMRPHFYSDIQFKYISRLLYKFRTGLMLKAVQLKLSDKEEKLPDRNKTKTSAHPQIAAYK